MTALTQDLKLEPRGHLDRTASSATAFSQPSLRPRPLNFSRPYVRITPSDTSSIGTRTSRTSSEWSADDDVAAPPIVATRAIGSATHADTPPDWTDEDDAAPPPAVRTYANNHSFDLGRLSVCDSIDEAEDAAPPPTVRTYANKHSLDLDRLSVCESVDEAIPPPIKSHLVPGGSSYQKYQARASPLVTERDGRPQATVHNPYTREFQEERASVASIADTEESDESYDTFETSDAETASIAESEHTSHSAATARSSVSDFAYDGRMGWDPRPPPLFEVQSQRWVGAQKPPVTNTSSRQATNEPPLSQQPSSVGSDKKLLKTVTRQSTASSSGGSSAATTGPPPIPHRIPRIVKRISMDQVSEHVSPLQGESMSDRGGSISSNEWSSSECDTSVLSIEKIHKLKKKGINPALYIEMKNARKGKGKWVNPLGGSAFLS